MKPPSQSTYVPGWNEVMRGGRLCLCRHTQVAHWNGDNRPGQQRFAGACNMCTCGGFQDSGQRRTTPQRSRSASVAVRIPDEDVEAEYHGRVEEDVTEPSDADLLES